MVETCYDLAGAASHDPELTACPRRDSLGAGSACCDTGSECIWISRAFTEATVCRRIADNAWQVQGCTNATWDGTCFSEEYCAGMGLFDFSDADNPTYASLQRCKLLEQIPTEPGTPGLTICCGDESCCDDPAATFTVKVQGGGGALPTGPIVPVGRPPTSAVNIVPATTATAAAVGGGKTPSADGGGGERATDTALPPGSPESLQPPSPPGSIDSHQPPSPPPSPTPSESPATDGADEKALKYGLGVGLPVALFVLAAIFFTWYKLSRARRTAAQARVRAQLQNRTMGGDNASSWFSSVSSVSEVIDWVPWYYRRRSLFGYGGFGLLGDGEQEVAPAGGEGAGGNRQEGVEGRRAD